MPISASRYTVAITSIHGTGVRASWFAAPLRTAPRVPPNRTRKLLTVVNELWFEHHGHVCFCLTRHRCAM